MGSLFHPVPGLTTRWSQFNPGSRHWTLTVEYKAGPHKFAENFSFAPYPRMPPIKWLEFERLSVERFILNMSKMEG